MKKPPTSEALAAEVFSISTGCAVNVSSIQGGAAVTQGFGT